MAVPNGCSSSAINKRAWEHLQRLRQVNFAICDTMTTGGACPGRDALRTSRAQAAPTNAATAAYHITIPNCRAKSAAQQHRAAQQYTCGTRGYGRQCLEPVAPMQYNRRAPSSISSSSERLAPGVARTPAFEPPAALEPLAFPGVDLGVRLTCSRHARRVLCHGMKRVADSKRSGWKAPTKHTIQPVATVYCAIREQRAVQARTR